MGNGYGLVYAVLYGGYTLVLLVVLGIGWWCLRRGWRVPGVVILGALAAWCVVPPILDRIAFIEERGAIDAATALPEDLSFEGQRVLVIEAGNSICGDFCGDLVRLGVPGEFYWIGIGHLTGEADVPNPDFAILNHGDEIVRVDLGAPVEDLGGMRYAEQVEGAEIPPFDVVIIDDNGYLRSYAPRLLGLPERLIERTQVARVVIEDWRDPFSEPAPDPTYRSVAPWRDVRAFIYWPLSQNDNAYPSISETEQAWNAAICPNAGPPEERDAFTYAFLCDRSLLDEGVGGGG